jgi:predicted aminopeptidase
MRKVDRRRSKARAIQLRAQTRERLKGKRRLPGLIRHIKRLASRRVPLPDNPALFAYALRLGMPNRAARRLLNVEVSASNVNIFR